MAITITRTAWTDDDGTGTVGSVINNAEKTGLYDQIDAALALLLPLAGGTLTGALLGTTAEFSGNATVGGTLGIAGNTTGPKFLSGAGGWNVLLAGDATDGAYFGTNIGFSNLSTINQPAMRMLGDGTTPFQVQTSPATAVGVARTWTTRFYVNTDGTLRASAYGSGTATFDASGNITSASDERMKDIEGPFAPGLKAVLGIKPIRYRWKKDTGLDVDNVYAGFSAQNVLGAVPEAIGKQNDRYSLNIVPVLAAVVNAIQELAKEADELRVKTGLPAITRTMIANTSEARIVDSARVKKVA